MGLQREKNPEKNGEEKNLGGGPDRPFEENGGKRREKWKEWDVYQCAIGCLGRATGKGRQ